MHILLTGADHCSSELSKYDHCSSELSKYDHCSSELSKYVYFERKNYFFFDVSENLHKN